MKTSPEKIPPRMLRRVRKSCMGKGLQILAEAYEYAEEIGEEIWQFSVRFRTLENAGLNENAIRWLMSHGFIQQAVEKPRFESTRRLFQKINNLCLMDASCFVLTPNGVTFTNAFNQDSEGHASVNSNAPSSETKPVWRRDRRELLVGRKLVKRFRVPAKNQIAVLDAFQSENWPFRIENPIPQTQDSDPFEQLHEAIKRLNQRQLHPLIRFHGDGTGTGVLWQLEQEGDS